MTKMNAMLHFFNPAEINCGGQSFFFGNTFFNLFFFSFELPNVGHLEKAGGDYTHFMIK